VWWYPRLPYVEMILVLARYKNVEDDFQFLARSNSMFVSRSVSCFRISETCWYQLDTYYSTNLGFYVPSLSGPKPRRMDGLCVHALPLYSRHLQSETKEIHVFDIEHSKRNQVVMITYDETEFVARQARRSLTADASACLTA
jgi:hypothetical protein